MSSFETERPKVSTLLPQEWSGKNYDASVFALGFESRATNLLDTVRGKSQTAFALGFNHGHERAFEVNKTRFENADVQIYKSLSDEAFENVFKEIMGALKDDAGRTVFVDISCFNRFRLAALVHEVFMLAQTRHHELIVDFAYSVAEFEKPTLTEHPNTVVGPVHPAFAGWSQGGYSSTAAVLGLGYEQDQALGAAEYLQAGEVWAFAPNSPISKYRPEVSKANKLLIAEMPPSHLIEYDVCSPVSVIATLESVVRGLSGEHSVVLVPFGPKIFVLCSLVLAAIQQDIAVWRVSQESHIEPHDRRASNVAVGLRLIFP